MAVDVCLDTAVNTWNTHRAAVLSWLGWCRAHGYEGPAVPAWAKRLAVPDTETPVRSKMAVGRLIAGREVHARKKTLRRMLYETTARAEEILGVGIEELDLARAGRVRSDGHPVAPSVNRVRRPLDATLLGQFVDRRHDVAAVHAAPAAELDLAGHPELVQHGQDPVVISARPPHRSRRTPTGGRAPAPG
jgi:hypothetical protein